MPAENSGGAVQPGMLERACGHLAGVPPPTRVETVNELGQAPVLEIKFLHRQERLGGQAAQQRIVAQETVELVAVNGEVAYTSELPHVFLVDRYANQMGHNHR